MTSVNYLCYIIIIQRIYRTLTVKTMNETQHNRKSRKSVKTFPLIKWVGFKGDTKELKRITGALTLTRAIEAVIKEKINQEAK